MDSIAALVFDIDGTLVVPGRPPSSAIIAALAACRRIGMPCFAATARSQGSAAVALGELGWLAASGVFHNGGVGICASTGFRAAEEIPAEVVALTVAIVERTRPATSIGLHTADDRSSFRPRIAPAQLAQWGHDPRREREFSSARLEPACKIALWTEDRSPLAALADALRSGLGDRATVHCSDLGSFIAITATKVSKASMLLRLLERRGIDPRAVAAFGDDITDVGMLGAVGHPVAMSGGHPAALGAARWRSPPASEDGVAIMLPRLVPGIAERGAATGQG